MKRPLTNLFDIARRLVGQPVALKGVCDCLAAFDVVPVEGVILNGAATMPGSDFEDNVTIRCAVTSGMDVIVTRNLADFTYSPVPAISPGELLNRISAASP